MRVLLVEDEWHVADALRDVIIELEHEVRLAATAEAGLAALAGERFDAVLLDVLLPRKSGLDVLRAGIIQNRGIPVIGISGVATDAEIRTGLQLGATDFLQKPIPLDLMREVLDYARVLNEPLTKGADRRRSPRPTLAIPVRIVESGLLQWQTTSVDLSVFGLRVQGQAPRAAGDLVKLYFTPPGDGAELEMLAVATWRDANTQAFRFANLSAPTYERLRHAVDRLADLR